MGSGVLLYSDLETYCETPISAGAYRYAEQAEVLLWAYAIDEAEPTVWDVTRGDPMPADLKQALEDPSVMTVWHNGAGFDRLVLRHALGIDIPISRIHDTMVQALSHSLPGALGTLCDILRVPQDMAKLADGKKLVQKFCKPQPAAHKLQRATRLTHPTEWLRLMQYAANDITAMREVLRRLPTWNYPALDSERELFGLDQTINDRGVHIDLEFAHAAVRAVSRMQESLSAQTRELTAGAVQTTSQRDAFLEWVETNHGVTLPNLQAPTVERLIVQNTLPEPVMELLRIRAQASTSSTAKYLKFLETTGSDWRLRGVLQYCGASRTGRWSSRLVQLQNLPRQSMDPDEIEVGIEALKAGSEDLLFDDIMNLASEAIRGCIAAPEGRKLVAADLANIEGRVLAWVVGEQWKLDAFRAFDAGQGADLYKVAYARAFGIKPEEVTKEQRQIGKVMELALGYQGGVGAFTTFAGVYGLDLEDLANRAYDTLPADVLAHSTKWRETARKKKMPSFGLSDKAWIVCDALKNVWRRAHPAISGFWQSLEQAVVTVVMSPGQKANVGRLTMRRDGAWLRIKLPSGRCLSYPAIRIDDEGVVSYAGVDQYTRRWGRVSSYGGKWAENIVQAIARDVLAHGMHAAEAAGFEITLTVHDEIVCETPDTAEFTHERLAALMATPPVWAASLPLAAEGFEAKRYRK